MLTTPKQYLPCKCEMLTFACCLTVSTDTSHQNVVASTNDSMVATFTVSILHALAFASEGVSVIMVVIRRKKNRKMKKLRFGCTQYVTTPEEHYLNCLQTDFVLSLLLSLHTTYAYGSAPHQTTTDKDEWKLHEKKSGCSAFIECGLCEHASVSVALCARPF